MLDGLGSDASQGLLDVKFGKNKAKDNSPMSSLSSKINIIGGFLNTSMSGGKKEEWMKIKKQLTNFITILPHIYFNYIME